MRKFIIIAIFLSASFTVFAGFPEGEKGYEYKKKSYMDKQETTDWYDKRRKVLNKKIIKLTGMQYKGDSLYSTKICDYQIDDFYDFYSD